MIEAPNTIVTGIAQELARKKWSHRELPPSASTAAAFCPRCTRPKPKKKRGGEAEEAAAGEGGGRLGEGGR